MTVFALAARRKWLGALAVFVPALAAAAGGSPGQRERPVARPREGTMTHDGERGSAEKPPARYVGELPGAGGAILWDLRLAGDAPDWRRYELRRTYLDQPAAPPLDAIGRWSHDLERDRITLHEAPGGPVHLAPAAGGALRKLDLAGPPITGAHSDLLARAPEAPPLELRVRVRGMLTLRADAPRLRLCADGRSLPVAMEADYLALERAVTAARADGTVPADAAVLVELDALIAPRRGMEEGRSRELHVVVERFGGVYPRETCGAPMAEALLQDMRWVLTRIDGRAARGPAPRQREATIVLQRPTRLAGFDGCSRINGRYRLDGAMLAFEGVADMEPVAEEPTCAGAAEQAAAFRRALAHTRSHRIAGSHLELLAADGRVLARLEVMPLR